MSSCSRRSALTLLGVAALGGCGFTPALGPGGAAEGLRGRIRVDPPSDRLGFVLRNHLEDRLGMPSSARFGLSVRIDTTEAGVAITPDQEITQRTLSGSARVTLRELGTDETVFTDAVTNFVTFSATGSTIATISSREDAEERLMRILADQIVTKLLASAPDWAQ